MRIDENEEGAEIERIAADFDRDGYALVPQLIQPDELDVLREETGSLVNGGFENKENPTDYMTAKIRRAWRNSFGCSTFLTKRRKTLC